MRLLMLGLHRMVGQALIHVVTVDANAHGVASSIAVLIAVADTLANLFADDNPGDGLTTERHSAEKYDCSRYIAQRRSRVLDTRLGVEVAALDRITPFQQGLESRDGGAFDSGIDWEPG